MHSSTRNTGLEDQDCAESLASRTERSAHRGAMRGGNPEREASASDSLLETVGVVYPDGSSLLKPQHPTPAAQAIIAVLLVIAAIIGGLFLWRFIDAVYYATAREEATVQTNLAREVSLDLPNVASYITYDDASLAQTFADSGYNVYEISSSSSDSSDNLDLLKLPNDVSPIEGAALYAQGISNLSASDASRLLNGSWRFTVSRGSQTSMQVRYVDFTAGNLEAAAGAAMASQGYDDAWVTSSGVDESGNLLREGTLTLADGRTASWRVAAIELEHVYDISGIPDSAVYVGIRVTV